MTTKNDELKALEKIKAIVDGLGSDSYLAAAFDGCFEQAKENIDNDWCCSIKHGYEIALTNIEKANEKINDLKRKLACAEKEIEDRKNDVEKLAAHVVPDPVKNKLLNVLSGNIKCLKVQMTEYADTMADLGEDPDNPEFQNAVVSYRAAKEQLCNIQSLAQQLK